MPAKISKEFHQRIYDLKDRESKTVKEILGILKSEGIKISDKSIYNILKEKTNNRSLTSFDEEEEKEEKELITNELPLTNPFNESFGEEEDNKNIFLPTLTRGEVIIDNEKLIIEEEKTHTANEINLQEDNINLQNDIFSLINKGVKEGTEQVISMINKDISERMINLMR